MKETILPHGDDIASYWQHAGWYRATTLTERAALQRGADKRYRHSELAEQRLQRWKEQLPFKQDASYFTQRLAMDLLTEDDLLTLLDEPIEAVQASSELLPAWLTELLQAFETQGFDDDPLPLSEATEKRVVGFLTTIKPLLRAGQLRVQQGIERLSQQYSSLPFDPATIISVLFVQVPGLVLSKLLRTIALELNVARVQGRLQGETPEDRFYYFLDQLANPSGMLPLLEEYAVLARLLVETIERWVTCSLELLERLCADWEEIRATFLPEEEPGVLVEVQAGKGDMHRGGRTVTILVWQSGFRLVYKPRSVAIDLHFQEVLSWLNASGYQPAFYTLKILDKQTYGWVEYVQHSSCSSPDEVERFYRRQGGYLALLYALEAGDVHADNLIAAGEHPVLIDLEVLFQPRIAINEDIWQEYPGVEMINRSVLRTSLLPRRLWSTDEGEGVDISGLGGQRGQLMPKPVAQWTQIGTDQMHMQNERIELPVGNHRPRLQDQEVDTLAYCESIIAGFTAAYRLIAAHREALHMYMLSRFAQDEIRCLLRASRIYGLLISDSFHPNMLRDALDRDRFVDRLWAGIEQRPYLSRIIAAERDDILVGDIPVFTTRPDSRDLFTSHGERIAEFFEQPALESLNLHLQSLNEEDLERQVWIIKASFTSMALGGEKGAGAALHLRPSQTAASYDRLVTAAQAVGDRLSKLALHTNNRVGWLGVTPVNEREWHLLPTEADIYSGTAGIALFLAYLGALTGETRYTELALLAQRSTRYQIDRQKELPGAGIGGFNGLGAYIYLLSHLGSLWHEPALYREAEELVRLLPDMIARDQMFDVIGGTAGCIAALLSLHSVAPSQKTLAVAIQCGEHLLASAQSMSSGIGWCIKNEVAPLAGLAHGNAGIALNLLRLTACSGDERFRQAARDAMAYERSLFSSAHHNWPDLRSAARGADGRSSYMVAWCHGAAGIGLARLASLNLVSDRALVSEIESALHTTLEQGFGYNHSLCHGDMGNLDALLAAAQMLPQGQKYREHVQRIVPMLLDSIETQGWVTGIPQGVETPGLMIGIAGTGYALLRAAAPERVPSVLLLDPPR